MRRSLYALLVAGLVFALAYGAAASLSVDGGVLQAGSDDTLQCDTDGVDVSYTVGWTDNDGFKVTNVTVSGISNACEGKTLAVQLTSGGSGVSAESTTITGTSVTIDVPDVLAATVDDVHVAIY